MNASNEWLLTEQMMTGDFNPFHDPKDGRFTSGHKMFNHTNKFTGEVRPTYYGKVARDLNVDMETAKRLADSVNEYTRHSKEFREYTADPKAYAEKYGPEAAAKQQALWDSIEDFLDKSPKWSGGRLYRGIELSQRNFAGFMANVERGGEIPLKGPSSWSSDKKIADLFSGSPKGVDINGSKASVILVTNKKDTPYGSSIAHLSGAPIDESEVLVTSKAKFYPSGKVVGYGSSVYVYGDIA